MPEAYGVDYRRAADYELDFLITPEPGGAPDPGTCGRSPYRAGPWNAHVKDELERELQNLVCRAPWTSPPPSRSWPTTGSPPTSAGSTPSARCAITASSR